jgi:hypothetical protein
MPRFSENWINVKASRRLVFALLAFTTIFAGWVFAGQDGQSGQSNDGPPQVCEGSLVYRSPISGRYETVPLVHTDVALDVRGLAAAATVTQRYVNSSEEPIEAVYVFRCLTTPRCTTWKSALATG